MNRLPIVPGPVAAMLSFSFCSVVSIQSRRRAIRLRLPASALPSLHTCGLSVGRDPLYPLFLFFLFFSSRACLAGARKKGSRVFRAVDLSGRVVGEVGRLTAVMVSFICWIDCCVLVSSTRSTVCLTSNGSFATVKGFPLPPRPPLPVNRSGQKK